MSTEALIVRSTLGEGREVPAALQGLPTDIGGQPVKYVRKAILKAGRYSHPKLGPLEFTRADLEATARGTRDFITDGGRVYLPPGHKSRADAFPEGKAPLNYGWLLDPAVEGDTLYGTVQLIGADAHREAARNDVSVCVRKDFVGGNGKTYPRMLEHLAICPDPVAMGLGDFVPLSRDSGPAEAVPVYMAARTEEPTMDLAPFRKRLGLADNAPEADVSAKLIEKLDGIQPAIDAATKPLSDQVAALSRERDDAKAKVTELSRGAGDKPKELDPELAHERRLRLRDALAKVGGTPAWVQKATALLAGTPETPNALMLSRKSGGDDLVAMDFIDLLREFKPAPETGEAKVLTLSRQVEGEEQDDTKLAEEGRAAAAEYQKRLQQSRGLATA